MYERLLEDFALQGGAAASSSQITLVNPQGYTFTLSLFNATTLRVTLSGEDRPLPPNANVTAKATQGKLQALNVDEAAKQASFSLADGKRVELGWKESISLRVSETLSDGTERSVYESLRNRSYLLSERGMIAYTRLVVDAIHVGLGEKGAPIDLTHRAFALTGTDGAAYDAYLTDPLYKHTPFLMTIPKPLESSSGSTPILPSPVAVYHATNSDGVWDVHHTLCDPWGYFTLYKQDFGGLEQFILLGDGTPRKESETGARELTRGLAELVGKPLLVPRDWLGYLASGMGLGESDSPPAQDLLMEWPDLCKKHDIPCSAIHLSSGYTVGDDGNRYVFGMNTKRYPDFAALTANFHKAGIKICPNIKPYVLSSHPDYEHLRSSGALFYDPFKKDQVETRLWSSGIGENGKGGWVDMTHPAGYAWWCKGVQSLIDVGADTMWNDNNEYLQHNDDYECANQAPVELNNPVKGQAKIGLMGRMLNTQMMAKASHDTLLKANPDRRPFVLTRSGNIGTFHYAASTWSGDNLTCWKTLQGSVAMGLNAGMSLMQSYGTDVGGFAGPLPSPELFARWVQFGVTNSRFCIHSFKPTKEDPTGVTTNNLPWMHPEVLPIIRATIKRRYEMLPFFNNLNWESHLSASPPNTWLGFGPFSRDPECYSQAVLDGFDYWLGTGRLLVAGAYHEGQTSKRVYFPKSHAGDKTEYIRTGTGAQAGERFAAGTWAEVQVPLEEFAIFARAGAVVPIGKDYATVTSTEGAARSAIDGVPVQLESEGGQVGIDDFRGVEIFPPREAAQDFRGIDSWIEDDGVSLNPGKTVVRVEYTVSGEGVAVSAKFEEKGFSVAWGSDLWVKLPKGDERKVAGAQETKKDASGRTMYKIQVA